MNTDTKFNQHSSKVVESLTESSKNAWGKYGVQITVIKKKNGFAWCITPKIRKPGSPGYTGYKRPQFVKQTSPNAEERLLSKIKDALDGKDEPTRLH